MIDTDSIRQTVDLLTLTQRDSPLKRVATTGGGEWAGPCPFCGGRDRFRVQPQERRWLCRHCTEGKWADAIAYVVRRESCDFRRACELLGAVEAMPDRPRPAVPLPDRPSGPPPAEWQDKARRVIAECEAALWAEGGAQARAYLHGRGLTDDTLRRWHIGYCPGGYTEWRAVAGLSVPCGVVIPCEVGGAIWYLKTRRAKAEPGRKYPQVKGGRPALFGAETLRGREVAVLVEGEFDAMLLAQESGDLCGVATLGSAGSGLDLTTWGAYLLSVARLLIAYDADKAGKDGAGKIANLTARVRRVTVPTIHTGDKDASDFYKAGGKLRDWLAFELARIAAAPVPSVSAHAPAIIETVVSATADPIIGTPAERWAALLANHPLTRAAWARWESASGDARLPLMADVARAALAEGVHWFPDDDWGAWLWPVSATCADTPDDDPQAWQFVMGGEAEALAFAEVPA